MKNQFERKLLLHKGIGSFVRSLLLTTIVAELSSRIPTPVLSFILQVAFFVFFGKIKEVIVLFISIERHY